MKRSRRHTLYLKKGLTFAKAILGISTPHHEPQPIASTRHVQTDPLRPDSPGGLIDRAYDDHACAGKCPTGWKCCAGTEGCAPLNGDCCAWGDYCISGHKCRIWQGQKACCPSSGCPGERNSSTPTLSPHASSPGTATAVHSTSIDVKGSDGSGLSAGAITGIVVGVLAVTLVIVSFVFRKKLLRFVKRDPKRENTPSGTVHQVPELLAEDSSQYLSQSENSHSANYDRGTDPKTNSLMKAVRGGGWRTTLYIGSIISIFVLALNIAFTVWAAVHHQSADGNGVLFEGHCQTARNVNTGLHLVINVLATLLLGASNYGMQCLSAPTRKDLDRAHKDGRSLDIGVLSMRNLLQIPRRMFVLWIILAFTSLPFHLLYNSTIYLTLNSYEYVVLAGKESFSHFSVETLRQAYEDLPWMGEDALTFETLRRLELNGDFRRLEITDCIDKYEVDFQSAFSNVLLISEDVDPGNGIFAFVSRSDLYQTHKVNPWGWLCMSTNEIYCEPHLEKIREHSENLTVRGYHTSYTDIDTFRVDYCLAQEVPEKCRVEYSLSLLITIVIFNVIKAGVLWGTTLTTDNTPLLTIGDAIAEFLEQPESSTLTCDQWKFYQAPKMWHTVVSKRRWILYFLLYCGCITTSIGLLIYAFHSDKVGSWTAAMKMGLGTADVRYMIQGAYQPKSLLGNSIEANITQLIFSVIYFVSNGILTAMAQANEWSQYALSRKGLRVSAAPKGSQRSTYFLSLPYRYSVPFLAFSIIIHWLISESLFLIAVEVYSPSLSRVEVLDFKTCGYSPVGVVSTLAVGSFMVFCLTGMAWFRPFRSGIPIPGSSSLAISAACHPYPSDEASGQMQEVRGIGARKLQWGVIASRYHGVEHCSFSDQDVTLPVDQRFYK